MKQLINNLILNIKYHFHICQEEGCWQRDATPCFFPQYDNLEEVRDVPDNYYCSKHAHSQGFCWCCGNFWAGIESFDFVHPGLCDNCYDELEIEFHRGDDDEDYDDYGFDDYMEGVSAEL